MDHLEHENGRDLEKKSPSRRNSRKMKVIASPTSTLERNIAAPVDGIKIEITEPPSHSGVKKSPENKFRTHKRSNSEDMTEKQRKGLLSVSALQCTVIIHSCSYSFVVLLSNLKRIKSNISARKKGLSESPKHHPKSAIPSHMIQDEQAMRNRVTSISGKHMRSKGMGITFGESSSGNKNGRGQVFKRVWLGNEKGVVR